MHCEDCHCPLDPADACDGLCGACLESWARTPDDEPDPGWLCSCGEYNDHDFHCDACHAEPPWGCDCCATDDWDDNDLADAFPGDYD